MSISWDALATELAYQVVNYDVKKGEVTQDQKDSALLRLAEVIKLRGLPRSKEYLEHFLAGSGKEKHFPCEKLFKDDQIVRGFVMSEISRLLRGNRPRGIKPNLSVDPNSEAYKKAYSRIPVPQASFSAPDWRYATGSFVFGWEEVQACSEACWIVKVWGKDLYQWHASENRASKRVHEAGDRLVRSGKAANFWIIADPSTFILTDYHGKLIDQITGDILTRPKLDVGKPV
jgi:hypothetical protein